VLFRSSQDETTALTILGARLATLGDASERRTFWEPGPWEYYCQYHPEMRGEIIVR
jgi:plastocyanin